jgi:hypothetical protein
MRYRACFAFLILASAAACATATDTPTVQLSGGEDAGVSFTNFSTRYFVNTAETIAWITFESGKEGSIATPNSRLLYNQKTGTTTGTGLLTIVSTTDGTTILGTLDLSRVKLLPNTSSLKPLDLFGSCDPIVRPEVETSSTVLYCGGASFSLGGSAPAGSFGVYKTIVKTITK